MTKNKEKKSLVISNFTKGKTTNKDVFRFVDRNGNWTHYLIKSKDELYTSITSFLGVGYPKGEGFQRWLLSVTKDEAKEILEKAGDAGSKSHEAVELLVRGEKITMDRKFKNRETGRQEVLTPNEWRNVETWVAWATKYKLRTIASEHTTFSHSLKVAGTLDELGVVTVPEDDKWFPKEVRGKDVLILLDWKFSSGIYESYKAQVGIYQFCLQENKEFAEFFKAYKGRVFTGIVRAGTKHKAGYEMAVWGAEETQENIEKGKYALAFYHDIMGEFKPKVFDVPLEFEIKIPKVELPKKKKVTKKKVVTKKKATKKGIAVHTTIDKKGNVKSKSIS